MNNRWILSLAAAGLVLAGTVGEYAQNLKVQRAAEELEGESGAILAQLPATVSVAALAAVTPFQKIGYINLETIESQWVDYQVLKGDLDKLLIIDRSDILMLRDDLNRRELLLKERQEQGAIGDSEYRAFYDRLILEAQKISHSEGGTR